MVTTGAVCFALALASCEGTESTATTVSTASRPPVTWAAGSPWSDLPGSASGRCVDVADNVDVRSAGFVAGNFAAFKEGWDGTTETSKLYYIPRHPEPPEPGELAPAPRLSVTARHLDADGLVMRFQFGGNGYARAKNTLFYPTGTVLPSPGRWRIRAEAGVDQGCFEVTVGSS